MTERPIPIRKKTGTSFGLEKSSKGIARKMTGRAIKGIRCDKNAFLACTYTKGFSDAKKTTSGKINPAKNTLK
jgi:hypothetical protein